MKKFLNLKIKILMILLGSGLFATFNGLNQNTIACEEYEYNLESETKQDDFDEFEKNAGINDVVDYSKICMDNIKNILKYNMSILTKIKNIKNELTNIKNIIDKDLNKSFKIANNFNSNIILTLKCEKMSNLLKDFIAFLIDQTEQFITEFKHNDEEIFDKNNAEIEINEININKKINKIKIDKEKDYKNQIKNLWSRVKTKINNFLSTIEDFISYISSYDHTKKISNPAPIAVQTFSSILEQIKEQASEVLNYLSLPNSEKNNKQKKYMNNQSNDQPIDSFYLFITNKLTEISNLNNNLNNNFLRKKLNENSNKIENKNNTCKSIDNITNNISSILKSAEYKDNFKQLITDLKTQFKLLIKIFDVQIANKKNKSNNEININEIDEKNDYIDEKIEKLKEAITNFNTFYDTKPGSMSADEKNEKLAIVSEYILLLIVKNFQFKNDKLIKKITYQITNLIFISKNNINFDCLKKSLNKLYEYLESKSLNFKKNFDQKFSKDENFEDNKLCDLNDIYKDKKFKENNKYKKALYITESLTVYDNIKNLSNFKKYLENNKIEIFKHYDFKVFKNSDFKIIINKLKFLNNEVLKFISDKSNLSCLEIYNCYYKPILKLIYEMRFKILEIMSNPNTDKISENKSNLIIEFKNYLDSTISILKNKECPFVNQVISESFHSITNLTKNIENTLNCAQEHKEEYDLINNNFSVNFNFLLNENDKISEISDILNNDNLKNISINVSSNIQEIKHLADTLNNQKDSDNNQKPYFDIMQQYLNNILFLLADFQESDNDAMPLVDKNNYEEIKMPDLELLPNENFDYPKLNDNEKNKNEDAAVSATTTFNYSTACVPLKEFLYILNTFLAELPIIDKFAEIDNNIYGISLPGYGEHYCKINEDSVIFEKDFISEFKLFRGYFNSLKKILNLISNNNKDNDNILDMINNLIKYISHIENPKNISVYTNSYEALKKKLPTIRKEIKKPNFNNNSNNFMNIIYRETENLKILRKLTRAIFELINKLIKEIDDKFCEKIAENPNLKSDDSKKEIATLSNDKTNSSKFLINYNAKIKDEINQLSNIIKSLSENKQTEQMEKLDDQNENSLKNAKCKLQKLYEIIAKIYGSFKNIIALDGGIEGFFNALNNVLNIFYKEHKQKNNDYTLNKFDKKFEKIEKYEDGSKEKRDEYIKVNNTEYLKVIDNKYIQIDNDNINNENNDDKLNSETINNTTNMLSQTMALISECYKNISSKKFENFENMSMEEIFKKLMPEKSKKSKNDKKNDNLIRKINRLLKQLKDIFE